MLCLFKFITIYIDEKFYGKEVIILKSGHTENLFNEFVSSYQTCNYHPSLTSAPFVFVDLDGQIKLVTNVVDSLGGDDDIFALSMADDGLMELLAMS